MRAALLLALAVTVLPAPSLGQENPENQENQEASATAGGQAQDARGVSLEGLDKITARTFAIRAPLNETVTFDSLQITARRCVVSAEEAAPERTAFLEVTETKPDQEPAKLFSGWMFASSPSVSALEHPVYDIWVVDCFGYEGEPVEDTESGPADVEDEVEAPVEGVERPLD